MPPPPQSLRLISPTLFVRHFSMLNRIRTQFKKLLPQQNEQPKHSREDVKNEYRKNIFKSWSKLSDNFTLLRQLRRMNETTETYKHPDLRPSNLILSQSSDPFLKDDIFAIDQNNNSISLLSLLKNKTTLVTINYSQATTENSIKWANTFIEPFTSQKQTEVELSNENPFISDLQYPNSEIEDVPIQVIHLQLCSSPILLLVKNQILSGFTKVTNPNSSKLINSLCIFEDSAIERLQNQYELKRKGFMSQVFLVDSKMRLRWRGFHIPILIEMKQMQKVTQQLIENRNVDDQFDEEKENDQPNKENKKPIEQSLDEAELRVKKVIETLKGLR